MRENSNVNTTTQQSNKQSTNALKKATKADLILQEHANARVSNTQMTNYMDDPKGFQDYPNNNIRTKANINSAQVKVSGGGQLVA